MSTRTVTITGVAEPMLDHAANGRWRALEDVLDDQFEIVEPDSAGQSSSESSRC